MSGGHASSVRSGGTWTPGPEAFQSLGDDRFAWLSDTGTSLAEIELSRSSLTVRVNSLERLEAAQAKIEAAAGSSVRRSLGTLDGDSAALHARMRAGDEAAPPLDFSTLPPEAVQQLHGMLLEQIESGFDSPIPAFNGRTLRQVARSKSSADAVSWLREQERILRLNPQLESLDLRPLWQELGLKYQGLATDP